jgi:hypothetical protein
MDSQESSRSVTESLYMASTPPEKHTTSLQEVMQTRDHEEELDYNDFEGPEDPSNPINWPSKYKWTIVASMSVLTMLTYVSFSFLVYG